MTDIKGYRERVLLKIQKANASIGDIIEVTEQEENKTLIGALMPRTEYADKEHLVIKLKSGYNIGVKVTESTRLKVLQKGSQPAFISPPTPKTKSELPKAYIIGTGGTIASRVEYRTGGVEPALTAKDLYNIYPELSNIANITTEMLYNEFSENLTIIHWKRISQEVLKALNKKAEGIIISHGTDTMGYTAAALSFILQKLPIPVLLVGSQRSSDRPSSDAPSNLLGVLKVAISAPFSGVFVAMHETSSDDYLAIHRGVKVRKCHTSARDAFKSINAPLVARFNLLEDSLHIIDKTVSPRKKDSQVIYKENMEEKVDLIKFYPNMRPDIIEDAVNSGIKGLILEGSGLGHVSKRCYENIAKAIKDRIFVGMTSQCIWGRVNLNVYYTGRDLLKLGVTPLEDMLPETALIKLMWVLGQTNDLTTIKQLMLQNMVGEISETRWL